MAVPFGQPQMPMPGAGAMPPPGMAPGPAGMMPGASPNPMAPSMGALFSSIASLAENMPKTAMDKVREAMRLLDEARDEDPKISGNLSMAMGLIRSGPGALEKYGLRNSDSQPSSPQSPSRS